MRVGMSDAPEISENPLNLRGVESNRSDPEVGGLLNAEKR